MLLNILGHVPGIVCCSRWRPEPEPGPAAADEVDEFRGLGRKP
jgi:hypothetical protein